VRVGDYLRTVLSGVFWALAVMFGFGWAL